MARSSSSSSSPPGCACISRWVSSVGLPAISRCFSPVRLRFLLPAGGMSFVIIAKALGVQKAAEPAPEPAPVAAGKKAK